MTLVQIISTVTECLAAYRTRGILSFYLLTDAVVTVAMLALWNIHPTAYDPAWRIVAVLLVLFRGAVTLERTQPRRWPFYALGACAVHVWAANYPNVWPGSWLQVEIHAVAFCCLLFGLALIGERRNAAVAVLFLGTAAALYPAPWAMWIRPWLMWGQSACYLWIAAAPPSGLRR